MNKEQREELKRLAAEAFGWDWVCSPWRTEEGSRNADCGVYFLKREGHAYSICRAPRYSKESEWIPTGKFIAAANPQAITALLSALEAAEAENERLRKAVEDVLAWRVNEPCRGDLRDNDKSRDALSALVKAMEAK